MASASSRDGIVKMDTLAPPQFEKGRENDGGNSSSVDLERGSVLPPQSKGSELSDGTAVEPEGDDAFLVGWDGEKDPENPMNWSNGKKWGIIGSLSLITFLTPLASSMLAPGVPVILLEFRNFNNMVATFIVSIYILGFAFGPLLMAPLSEIYGRLWVYHVTNVLFLAFTVMCAESTSIDMLLAARFLAGFAGVTAITTGAGTISDLIPTERRGGAMAIWSLGPLLGPVIGPVCAGFVVEDLGWRWVFWIVTIASGASTILAFLVQRETYAPVLLERKAAKLRKETGDSRYKSKLQKQGTPRELFLFAIVRPARLFLFSPIVTLICLQAALITAVMYILFSTFSFVFRDYYHFDSVAQGLSFLSMGIGNFIGLGFIGILSDVILKRAKARAGPDAEPNPEARLHPLVSLPPIVLIPGGMFVYGWTIEYGVHWIGPMIGASMVGAGMIAVMMATNVYLVDVHTEYAASAMGANAVLRSLFGALLPLCAMDMYDALGLGWGNTLLGFLALLLAPIPYLMYLFGKRIRTHPRFANRKY